jgi:hypothetical protein
MAIEVERQAVCMDCSAEFVAAPRGVLPKRCSGCNSEHRRKYLQDRQKALPPRARSEKRLICSDCGAEFLWVARGPTPARCKPCAKARHQQISFERTRLVRAAKPAAGPRRGFCEDCSLEFTGPRRGLFPSRCSSCVEQWNKTRYKHTAGRSEASRRRYLRIKYGMTLDDWQEWFERQGGACAICKRLEGEVAGGLHVDHCHASGVIRGLLCQSCNTSIGHLREDPEVIRAAADYVERHSKVSGV